VLISLNTRFLFLESANELPPSDIAVAAATQAEVKLRDDLVLITGNWVQQRDNNPNHQLIPEDDGEGYSRKSI
jgi:hypothetical protein